MPITDKKVAESEYTGRDVEGLSNTPSADGVGAVALKQRFDMLLKYLIVKYNGLIDMLFSSNVGTSGARQIGYEQSTRIPHITVYEAVEHTNDRIDLLAGGTIPDSLNADVWVDGTTNKVMLATERTKLTGIEAGAEVNNISDVNATDLTDGGNTTLHTHDNKVSTPSLLAAKTTWADTDLIIVQDGADTKKMTVATLKALLGVALITSDTFTPAIAGTTAAGTATYTNAKGSYTKVGKLVTFHLVVAYSGHTGTGNMKVSGLPFASENIANDFNTFNVYISGITLAANNVVECYMNPNTSDILLQQYALSTGISTNLPMDAAGTIIISGSYQTA